MQHRSPSVVQESEQVPLPLAPTKTPRELLTPSQNRENSITKMQGDTASPNHPYDVPGWPLVLKRSSLVFLVHSESEMCRPLEPWPRSQRSGPDRAPGS